MLGVSNVVLGVVDLAVFPLTAAVYGPLGGAFLVPNAGLTAAEAACAIVPWYLWRQSRRSISRAGWRQLSVGSASGV